MLWREVEGEGEWGGVCGSQCNVELLRSYLELWACAEPQRTLGMVARALQVGSARCRMHPCCTRALQRVTERRAVQMTTMVATRIAEDVYGPVPRMGWALGSNDEAAVEGVK